MIFVVSLVLARCNQAEQLSVAFFSRFTTINILVTEVKLFGRPNSAAT